MKKLFSKVMILVIITIGIFNIGCTKVDLNATTDIMENQIEDIISNNVEKYWEDKSKYNSLDQLGQDISRILSNRQEETDISVELTEEDDYYQAIVSFAEELIHENQFNTAKYTIKINKKEKFKNLNVEELLFSTNIEVTDLTRYYWTGNVVEVNYDNETLKEMLYQDLGYAEYNYTKY